MELKRTRTQLLRLKRTESIARYGKSIIQKKTVLLTSNLFTTLSKFRKDIDTINSIIVNALKASDLAIAIDGVTPMVAAANSVASSFEFNFKYDNYIGTAVPLFYLKEYAIKRGYTKMATSLRIDETSNRFSELLKETIENANLYIRIRKLAEAIYQTRIRYNVIDKKLLPSLLYQENKISEFLDATALSENFVIRMFAD